MGMRNEGYTKAIVICHGKSEFEIMRHIKSKLRVSIVPYAKDNGERSIEIASLMGILNNSVFKNRKALLNNFPKIEVDGRNNPVNFKIFPVLDVDFTSKNEVLGYTSGTMFSKHWLSPYIQPILNDNNLEEVLNSIGYTAVKKDREKKMYRKIFPVERGKQDKEAIIALRKAFADTKKSNFIELLDYCLQHCPEFE